ncbi:hypothetical protein pdam_00024777 [Pocillopora damicornis]|uniref:Uncharacterized protein n=1 Tax=Pocillopora damicornis TaxID=46731 RepID=A0A3M6UL73_POCDA|nr:hypothetical protein pdam_00024777 [Pocillopora damicornis]
MCQILQTTHISSSLSTLLPMERQTLHEGPVYEMVFSRNPTVNGIMNEDSTSYMNLTFPTCDCSDEVISSSSCDKFQEKKRVSPMRRSLRRKEREEMLKLKFLLSHETHDVVHQYALNKTAN